MPKKRWIEKRITDPYYVRSKREGYSSRAAFKLEEMKKFHIFRGARVIIDLCSSPGSWIEVLTRETDAEFILGIDLKKIRVGESEHVHFLQGDVTDETLIPQILEKLPRLADLVLSDCSQKTSGAKATDHARQMFLAECSLEIALNCLRPGGIFVTKVFQGDLLHDFVSRLKDSFFSVKRFKPRASLKSSAEMYVLGFGKKAVRS
ncbi:MAG: SAM-dependent methyltransferase [Candidatus Helarchaeota archaeon]